MIVLAIDPGPKGSAFVLWDGSRIVGHGYLQNDDLVNKIKFCDWNDGLTVVIEWIEGYGLTVGRETFDTCRWVGRFEQAVNGCGVHLLGRKAIKSHLCCTTQAKDTHIRQALIDKIGPPGTRKQPGPTYGITGDEWAALACAVTFFEAQREDHRDPEEPGEKGEAR